MSDDYDGGDYDGDFDGDFDGDGIADSMDSDPDGDGDNDGLNSDRTDIFGNPMVMVNGEWMTQINDAFGNPTVLDGDRNVQFMVEPDGDIRAASGETFTPTDTGFGRDSYVSAEDGSLITPTDTFTGDTNYVIGESGNEGGADDSSDDSEESRSSSPEEAEDGEEFEGDGGEGSVDGAPMSRRGRVTSTVVNEPDILQGARDRRSERKEGFGCFSLIFFVFFEIGAIMGTTWIYGHMLFEMGMSQPEALTGIALVVALFYILTVLLWVITGRLFLFINFGSVDCFSKVLSIVMFVTPAITAYAMHWVV